MGFFTVIVILTIAFCVYAVWEGSKETQRKEEELKRKKESELQKVASIKRYIEQKYGADAGFRDYNISLEDWLYYWRDKDHHSWSYNKNGETIEVKIFPITIDLWPEDVLGNAWRFKANHCGSYDFLRDRTDFQSYKNAYQAKRAAIAFLKAEMYRKGIEHSYLDRPSS